MSIQWSLPSIKAILPEHLLARLQETSVDPYAHCSPEGAGFPVYNGSTGERIKEVPTTQFHRASRRKLRKLCAEGVNIQYDKRLSETTFSSDGASVTAHFKDGTHATGSLMIGADGAHSATRTSVLGKEKGDSYTIPYRGIATHVCYNDVEKAKYLRSFLNDAYPIQTIGIHPSGYWLWMSTQDNPSPSDPSKITFMLMTTWKKVSHPNAPDVEDPRSLSLDAQKERAKTFGDPFKSAFEWIPDDHQMWFNNISIWEPFDFDTRSGRVTVAGDAAHPMSFQRGQGLNHAITDAKELVDAVLALNACDLDTGSEDWVKKREELVGGYQKGMVERGGNEVRESVKNTEMLHEWEKVKESPFIKKGGAR